MQISDILSVIGIVISLAFGFWGVYQTIKYRYPGKISFSPETLIFLFDDITKDIPGLEVQFRNDPIKDNLVLIKGSLFNEGFIDILPTTVERPIVLSLPDGLKWIEANVIGCSSDIESSVKIINSTDLMVNTGLFKVNEFIRLQGLAEVVKKDEGEFKNTHSIRKHIENSIAIKQRIANTTKTDVVGGMNDKTIIKKSSVILPLSLIIFSVLFFYFGKSRPVMRMIYEYQDNKNVVEVIANRVNVNEVVLLGTQTEFQKRIPINDFVQNAKLVQKAYYSKFENIFNTSLSVISFILGVIALIPVISAFQRNSKYDQIFNSECRRTE